MSDYKIAICDDEEKCRYDLKQLLYEYEQNKKVNFDIKLYSNSKELLKEKLTDFDLFLLDIEMDYLNGVQTAKFIIKEYPKAIIMFITGYDSYLDYAFDLKVMRYLNKPVDKKRLFRALNIAILDIDREKEYIEVRDYRGQLYKIKVIDIIRIYIEGRKVALETSDSIYETNKTFSEMEEIISNFDFIHTYKKRMVNLIYVTGFKDEVLLLKKGQNEIKEYINVKYLSDVRMKWMLYGRKFR